MAESLLFISKYIYCLLCVGEELACLRIVAKKSTLIQNYDRNIYSLFTVVNPRQVFQTTFPSP